jgi:hypothetical protein
MILLNTALWGCESWALLELHHRSTRHILGILYISMKGIRKEMINNIEVRNKLLNIYIISDFVT